jgi:hypothetical protein
VVIGVDRQSKAVDRRNIRTRANNPREAIVIIALKSMALSAICGAFLSAVTVGAASAGSSSGANLVMAAEVKKLDPDCIKKCNDTVDACMEAAHSTAAKRTCKHQYTDCIGDCKF